jgi:hypothetical protein
VLDLVTPPPSPPPQPKEGKGKKKREKKKDPKTVAFDEDLFEKRDEPSPDASKIEFE